MKKKNVLKLNSIKCSQKRNSKYILNHLQPPAQFNYAAEKQNFLSSGFRNNVITAYQTNNF